MTCLQTRSHRSRTDQNCSVFSILRTSENCRRLVNSVHSYCCCCCWSPSRSTMTLHCYELLKRWTVWIRRWLRRPNSEAQTLLQWGQRGPVFGLAVAAWRAARRFIEVLAQPFMKSLKPTSHTVLHISFLAEASKSESWKLPFCMVTLKVVVLVVVVVVLVTVFMLPSAPVNICILLSYQCIHSTKWVVSCN